MRQGVGLQAKRLGHLGRAHALWGEAHEQPKDSKAIRVAEDGEGMGGVGVFHISGISEIKAESSEDFMTGAAAAPASHRAGRPGLTCRPCAVIAGLDDFPEPDQHGGAQNGRK